MPSLKDAYSLRTPEDSEHLYAGWAASYDESFARARGYVYPVEVARLLLAVPPGGRILDVGAGTGLVGEALAGCGAQIDAVDISPDMLGRAEAKGVYARVIAADLTRPLPLESASYGGLVSAGTFTHGHVGPSCLPELMRVAAPGARVALGISAEVFDRAGFGSAFARLSADGVIGPIAFEGVPIYAGSDHAEAGARALVAIFERA